MVPSKFLAVGAFVASFLCISARDAKAGCIVECSSIEGRGVTLTPPLPCLVTVGAPDDNACVCGSTYTVRNDCPSALSIVRQERDPSCVSGCEPGTVSPGSTVTIEVRASVDRSAESTYTIHATEKYEVHDVTTGTSHVAEVAADATIDPNAGSCSASPARPRTALVPAAILGIFLALALRRKRD